MTLGYGSVQNLELDSMILVGLFNSVLSVTLWFQWIINTYFYMARIGRGVPQPRRLHQRIWSIYVSTRAGKKRSLLLAKGEPRRRQKVVGPHTWILDSVRQSSADLAKAGLHKKVLPSLSNPASAGQGWPEKGQSQFVEEVRILNSQGFLSFLADQFSTVIFEVMLWQLLQEKLGFFCIEISWQKCELGMNVQVKSSQCQG